MKDRGARIGAAIVALLAAGALVWLNRETIVPKPSVPQQADRKLNPEFVACRDERVKQVEDMHSQGLVNNSQFDTFRQRAIDTCAGQFPPDQN